MADLANYVKFLRGTPEAYKALTSKDSNTLYFISKTDEKVGKLYLGDILVAGNVTEDGTSVLDSLGELTDVNLQGLVSGQVLGYNGTNWVPMDLPEAFEASIMGGAEADKAGTAGYVPAPQAGDHVKFLRGDGTWLRLKFLLVHKSLKLKLKMALIMQQQLLLQQVKRFHKMVILPL